MRVVGEEEEGNGEKEEDSRPYNFLFPHWPGTQTVRGGGDLGGPSCNCNYTNLLSIALPLEKKET